MGIALLSAARLVMALPVWFDRLTPGPLWPRLSHGRLRAARPSPARHATPHGTAHTTAPQTRPLRVLRVVDPTYPAGGAGRMVISGRMADVCAELDRLAAAEDAAARR